MNSSGAALLTNPHPCRHIVYPYTDEGLVGQAVCLFASAGLRDGEGVILIMTSSHFEPIMVRLCVEGFDCDAYQRSGQLVCLKSEELLEKFVVDGALDENVFKATVGELIEQVRAKVSNGSAGKVRVFGEMVSQLRNTNLSATTELEKLWNDIIHDHSVGLLCTYSLHHSSDHIPDALVELHTDSIERESVAANKG